MAGHVGFGLRLALEGDGIGGFRPRRRPLLAISTLCRVLLACAFIRTK